MGVVELRGQGYACPFAVHLLVAGSTGLFVIIMSLVGELERPFFSDTAWSFGNDLYFL